MLFEVKGCIHFISSSPQNVCTGNAAGDAQAVEQGERIFFSLPRRKVWGRCGPLGAGEALVAVKGRHLGAGSGCWPVVTSLLRRG